MSRNRHRGPVSAHSVYRESLIRSATAISSTRLPLATLYSPNRIDHAEEPKKLDEPEQPKNPKKDEHSSTHVGEVDAPNDEDQDTFPDDAPCPDVIKEAFWCSECGDKDEDGKCKGVSGRFTFEKLVIRWD